MLAGRITVPPCYLYPGSPQDVARSNSFNEQAQGGLDMVHFKKLLVTLAVCSLILPSAACKHGDSEDNSDKQTKKIKVKDKKVQGKNKKLKEKQGDTEGILERAEEKYEEFRDKIESDENYRELRDKIESDERYQEIKENIENEVEKYRDKNGPDDD
jgi:hypothetical protein